MTEPLDTNKKAQLTNAITDPKSVIFAVATQQLKDMITSNEHPIIKQLPPLFKNMFLANEGIVMNPTLITQLLDNTISVKQRFLLDLCVIHIKTAQQKIRTFEDVVKNPPKVIVGT